MEQLYELQKLWNAQKANLRKVLFTPQRILPFLNIGRVVHLVDGDIDWGYGISVNFHKKDSYKKNNNKNDASDYQVVIDAMVHIKPK